MAKIVRALDCYLVTWTDRDGWPQAMRFTRLETAKAWCVAEGVRIVLVME